MNLKKKNFLRNLSTTALAMCCLSSAVAFPSYASLNKGPKLTLTKPASTSTALPVIDKDGQFVFKKDSCCTLTYEADSIWGSSIAVTGSTENNNQIVVVPEDVEVINGNKMKVKKINPDAKFLNTKTLVFPNAAEFDEAKIRENNPGISLLLPYNNNNA